jgi:hypothetical protein
METQMNNYTNNPLSFKNFIDTYVQELIATSDEQILEGEDVSELMSDGARLLDTAKAEAGKRRLAAAKTRMMAIQSQPQVAALDVPVEEARRYLNQAANDTRFTLAARNLSEISDDDLLRLYHQLKRLESESDLDKDIKA